MATNLLPVLVRPANPAATANASGLSKSTARSVDMARLHLRDRNPGAYARAFASEHRSTNTRQQRAIEAVIASDACERLFTRHLSNGCLMAREG